VTFFSVGNNYQGSEITVFPRVEQNPTTGNLRFYHTFEKK